MKVIVGGLSHETNTYATALWGTTELSAFTQSAGADMLEKHRTARTCVGGMLAAASELSIEIVPRDVTRGYTICTTSPVVGASHCASVSAGPSSDPQLGAFDTFSGQ